MLLQIIELLDSSSLLQPNGGPASLQRRTEVIQPESAAGSDDKQKPTDQRTQNDGSYNGHLVKRGI